MLQKWKGTLSPTAGFPCLELNPLLSVEQGTPTTPSYIGGAPPFFQGTNHYDVTIMFSLHSGWRLSKRFQDLQSASKQIRRLEKLRKCENDRGYKFTMQIFSYWLLFITSSLYEHLRCFLLHLSVQKEQPFYIKTGDERRHCSTSTAKISV